ncbi:MAG: hypothetical protein ACREIC_21800, partial [Limisphaerales bacterium]
FHYSDVLLRTPSGNYETNDGALAMDLTHPGTQERITYYADRLLNAGFDYIKIDFLSHGALEGVHYNSAVTTGIQAYNQGMRYLLTRLNGHMFISESIAPLFPYQYAHARRIACDAQSSRISDTAYTMSSVTYGWWLGGRLYAYNDPDVMVFGNGASLNENESRVICGAITGLFLDGDSLSNSASIGAAQLSLTNAALDALARGGHSFSPTEGNTGANPADVFEWQDGSSWYLAVFNYNAYATNKVLSLTRAGITGNVSPLDLWSGAVLPLTNSLFPVSLNADQAKIFRLRSQPRLLHSQSSGPQFIFDLQGDPDTPYAIQETSDLAAWSTLGFLTNVTGLASFTDAVPAGVATRAYRARLVP